jgi:hypothetical protein
VSDDAEAAWEAYRGLLPGRRRTSILAHRIFLAGRASMWVVNDDGSVSPPGHTDETAWIIREQRPDDIARPWFWFLAPPTGAHYPGESDNEETFAEAKAALLKALEDRD